MAHLEAKFRAQFERLSAHNRDTSHPTESNSSFHLSVNNRSTHWRSVVGIQVISASVPHVFYNVPADAAGNDYQQFRWTSGTNKVIDIPKGQYDITTLMTAVETGIIAHHPGATVTLDTLTSKVTIDFNLTPVETVTIHENYETNFIAHLLGWTVSDGLAHSAINPAILTAPSIVDLSGPSLCCIHCPELTLGHSDGSIFEDTMSLVQVPLNVDFGHVAYYNPGDSLSAVIEYEHSNRHFSELQFQLRDERGRPLDIQDADWSISLKVFFH